MTDKPEAKNNTYRLSIASPLLRPGMTISTDVSERYVPSAAEKLMALVREINQS